MKIKNSIRKGIAVELILLIILIVYLQKQPPLQAMGTNIIYNTTEWQEYPISNVALINTYLNDIRDATVAFYSDKYVVAPTVAWYMITLKNVIAKDSNSLNPIILITFESMPYLGAHNTVGLDEVTFQTSYTGETLLIEYKQLQSFDLPEHLRNLAK